MKSTKSKSKVPKTASSTTRRTSKKAAAKGKNPAVKVKRTGAKVKKTAVKAKKASAREEQSAAKAKNVAAKAKNAAAKAKNAAAKAKNAAAKAKNAAAKAKNAEVKPKRLGSRADFGAPIDGFFLKQPPPLRPILEALRALVEEVVPDASGSIKWGMPFYTVGGAMLCALGAHKSHVNLVLAGPPEAFADPDGRLSGSGKTGRHLKVTTLSELPTKAVRGWLRTASTLARSFGSV